MQELEHWLGKLENKTINDDKYAMLLLGKSGTGKTTLVSNFFKKHNYYLHVINTKNCHKKKFLTEVLNKIIYHRHNFFFDASVKHALLIDELEGVTATEKGSINEIIEMIRVASNQVKTQNIYPVPIVCISDENYLKKKNNLSKLCNIIYMPEPEIGILHKIIFDWAKDNDIKLSKTVIQLLVKQCNNDIYRLQNILIYIALTDIKKLTKQNIAEIFKDFYSKQTSNHLFTATEQLFTQNLPIEDAILYYTREPTLLPLMVHENAINFIKKPTKKDTIPLAQRHLEVMRSMANAMITEHQLYHKNEWDLHYLYGLQACYITTQKLQQYHKNSKPSLRYTLLLNKVSLKHTYLIKYREIMEKNEDIDLYFDKERVRVLARTEPQRWTKKEHQDLVKIT